MSESERQRRLKVIAEILANPEVPVRLRTDLEEAQSDLLACVAVQDRAARSWQSAATHAVRRRTP